jgi:sterol desaturase/sphingolipid hydroxylase (fatty acid hydroxylase superfamily)
MMIGDLFEKSLFLSFFLLFVLIALRYFGVAGFFYWFLWIRQNPKWERRKLQKERPNKKLIKSEIRWSILTSLVFALAGVWLLEVFKADGTSIYFEWRGWRELFYVPFSVFVFLFLHDTYFYWTHRWMHHPRLFKFFHKVHHNSPNPTPWAAFSFDLSESIVGALIIPLLVCFIPIHWSAFLGVLSIMTVCGVVNHSGYEIYPRFMVRGWIGNWLITPSHQFTIRNISVIMGFIFASGIA